MKMLPELSYFVPACAARHAKAKTQHVHSDAYQRFISLPRLCNLFIAEGSFLRNGRGTGRFTAKHACVYLKVQMYARTRVCESETGPRLVHL